MPQDMNREQMELGHRLRVLGDAFVTGSSCLFMRETGRAAAELRRILTLARTLGLDIGAFRRGRYVHVIANDRKRTVKLRSL